MFPSIAKHIAHAFSFKSLIINVRVLHILSLNCSEAQKIPLFHNE